MTKVAEESYEADRMVNTRDAKRGEQWIVVGSMVLAIAVILGAFGAHGLKGSLSVAELAVYKTAVQYHFYHGFGLILAGLLMVVLPSYVAMRWVPHLLLLGVVLFSGSLYMIAIFKLRWLGIVTPFGGVLFIIGWSLLAFTVFKGKAQRHSSN